MNKITLGVGITCAALAFAAPASADVPPAFVGGWAAADGQYNVTIDPSGHGRLSYADYTRCPSCSAASAPRTIVDFNLVSSSGNTASGTDSSGEVVTAKINGQGLWLTVDGKPTFVCQR